MRQALLDTDILSYIIDRRYPEVLTAAQQYIRVFRYFTIAATAIELGRPLVTNNTKHYQRVVDLGFPLELENWRETS